MAKFVKAMNLKRGDRVRFDSPKVYVVESYESRATHAQHSLNLIELFLSVEGEPDVKPFVANYYAGDQIEIIE